MVPFGHPKAVRYSLGAWLKGLWDSVIGCFGEGGVAKGGLTAGGVDLLQAVIRDNGSSGNQPPFTLSV